MQIQEITGIKQEAQLSQRGRMMPRVVEYYNSVCYEQAASDIVYNISAVIYHQVHCAFSVLTLLTWHWSGTLKICYRNPKGFPRQTSGELSLTSGKEGKLGRQNTSQASVVCVVLQWTVQTRKATTQMGHERCLRQASTSISGLVWPWPLTSWPPKLIASRPCPMITCANWHQNPRSFVFKICSQIVTDKRMDEKQTNDRTSWEHCIQRPVWPAGDQMWELHCHWK